LYPDHSEIGQDTATATRRQILPQGIAERNFSKVGTSKLYITGTAFPCQPRAVKSKPSAIAHIAYQFLHLLGHVKRPLTGIQFPETSERPRLNSGTQYRVDRDPPPLRIRRAANPSIDSAFSKAPFVHANKRVARIAHAHKSNTLASLLAVAARV
jgi:hypothetical protein